MRKKVSFDGLVLEGGEFLPSINVSYSTYGQLNEKKDNVIWVCHALTADDQVDQWWESLFGPGKFLDSNRYFIVCANVLGSCYGTTGPSSEELPNGYKRRHFPFVTIKDIVQVHNRLAKYLKIERMHSILGPSLGGQQALEWACQEPSRFDHVCLFASNSKHSPWGIAFNESQRMALWSDETFRSNYKAGGKFGLKAARAAALLSYRSYDCYSATQRESHDFKIDSFKASSYQQYQGDKIVDRFSPYSYWCLSKAMDSHNVGRGRGGTRKTIQKIRSKILTVGISSDVLFPPAEQREIADFAVRGVFREIDSIYGHDGFLLEGGQLNQLLHDFHNNLLRPNVATQFKTNYLN